MKASRNGTPEGQPMVSLTPTAEQQRALDADNAPIRFGSRHVIFSIDEAERLYKEYIRGKIQEGVADIEAGRVGPLNLEEMLAEARKRYAAAEAK